MSLYEEIGRVAKVKRRGDEEFPVFVKRFIDKVRGFSDAAWDELSEDLQHWHNAAAQAQEQKRELPALDGWPGSEDEPEEEADTSEETDEGTDDNSDGGDGEASEESGEDGGDDEEESGEDDGDSEAEPEAERRGSQEDVDEGSNSEEEGNTEAAEEASGSKSRSTKTKDKARKPVSTAKANVKATGKTKEKDMASAKGSGRPGTTPKSAPKKVAASSARTKIGDNDIIKVLKKTNPYREGSLGHKVFAAYKDGGKFKEFAAKIAKLDTNRPAAALLRFDQKKGNVKVQSAA